MSPLEPVRAGVLPGQQQAPPPGRSAGRQRGIALPVEAGRDEEVAAPRAAPSPPTRTPRMSRSPRPPGARARKASACSVAHHRHRLLARRPQAGQRQRVHGAVGPQQAALGRDHGAARARPTARGSDCRSRSRRTAFRRSRAAAPARSPAVSSGRPSAVTRTAAIAARHRSRPRRPRRRGTGCRCWPPPCDPRARPERSPSSSACGSSWRPSPSRRARAHDDASVGHGRPGRQRSLPSQAERGMTGRRRELQRGRIERLPPGIDPRARIPAPLRDQATQKLDPFQATAGGPTTPPRSGRKQLGRARHQGLFAAHRRSPRPGARRRWRPPRQRRRRPAASPTRASFPASPGKTTPRGSSSRPAAVTRAARTSPSHKFVRQATRKTPPPRWADAGPV